MVRKPRYQFLSRKQREAIDWATEKLLLDLLESGDVADARCIFRTVRRPEWHARFDAGRHKQQRKGQHLPRN
jgi:hypothetical protein